MVSEETQTQQSTLGKKKKGKEQVQSWYLCLHQKTNVVVEAKDDEWEPLVF